MSISLVEVNSNKDLKKFINFQYKLYKNFPCYPSYPNLTNHPPFKKPSKQSTQSKTEKHLENHIENFLFLRFWLLVLNSLQHKTNRTKFNRGKEYNSFFIINVLRLSQTPQI